MFGIGMDQRGGGTLQVPANGLRGALLQLGSVHPARGQVDDVLPATLERHFPLQADDTVVVPRDAAVEPRSITQGDLADRLDHRWLLELHVLWGWLSEGRLAAGGRGVQY